MCAADGVGAKAGTTWCTPSSTATFNHLGVTDGWTDMEIYGESHYHDFCLTICKQIKIISKNIFSVVREKLKGYTQPLNRESNIRVCFLFMVIAEVAPL